MSKDVISHGQLRELSDEELMHFKYVHKEKKNGKWVYYYHHKTGKNTASIYSSDTMNRDGYGTYTRGGGTDGRQEEVVTRRKTNKLFSSKSTMTISVNNERGKKYVYENVGRLEQSYERLSKKVAQNSGKITNWIKSIFSKKK